MDMAFGGRPCGPSVTWAKSLPAEGWADNKLNGTCLVPGELQQYARSLHGGKKRKKEKMKKAPRGLHCHHGQPSNRLDAAIKTHMPWKLGSPRQLPGKWHTSMLPKGMLLPRARRISQDLQTIYLMCIRSRPRREPRG